MNEGVHHMETMEVGLLHKLKFKIVWAVLFFCTSVVSLNVSASYYYAGGTLGYCGEMVDKTYETENAVASAAAQTCYAETVSNGSVTVTRSVLGVSLYLPSGPFRGNSIWEVAGNRYIDYVSTDVGDGNYPDPFYIYVSKKPNSPTPLALGEFPQGEFTPVGNQPKAKTCNPIHIVTGNKYKRAVDLPINSFTPLSFHRYYNSLDPRSTELGYGWRHSFQSSIETSYEGKIATVNRPDGVSVEFSNFYDTGWVSDLGITSKLSKTVTGWQYKTATKTELFNQQGQLISITNEQGRVLMLGNSGQLDTVTDELGNQLIFTYQNSLLSNVTASDGRNWQYNYDINNNLVRVTNPDNTFVQYDYTNSDFINSLTGITDERGIAVEHYEYDASGRAIASYKGNKTSTLSERIDAVSIQYDGLPYQARQITSSRGAVTTYDWFDKLGASAITKITGPGCAACGSGANTSYLYDDSFNVTSSSDNGVTTNYGNYDSNGNYGFKEIAVGTPEQRRIDYTYDPRFYSKITTITEPSVALGQNKVTTNTYDSFGNLETRTIDGFTPTGTPVSRKTTFKYEGPLNQLSEIDGPRTDVADITTIDYYPNDVGQGNNRARVQRITASGIITRDNIQYTATGKVASEQRPNGVSLTYQYYAGNDRLQTLTQSGGSISKTTQWTYLATGEAQTITRNVGTAAASTLTFGYDVARRLTSITDNNGNRIVYTLDTEGNRTNENVYDNASQLKRSITQTFDLYNKLDINNQANESADYNYLPDGTLGTVVDGNNATTDYSYDALKRLTATTQDLGGSDPATQNATSSYGYDSQDNLTSVTDPINGNTTYAYDDLGNLLQQTSPDSGTTIFTYDAAGNINSKTDARNIIVNYTYDALNRLRTQSYNDTTQNVFFTYDNCPNGIGHLCQMTDNSGSTAYSYNSFGSVTQTINIMDSISTTIGYGYNSVNQLNTITYPDGRTVVYDYNNLEKVTTVNTILSGVTQPLASNITYEPFGPMNNIDYGNGFNTIISYDTAGRINSITLPQADNNGSPPPTANAGSDQIINENATVTLTGTGQSSGGTINGYTWSQTAGPGVVLTGINSATASFTAPNVTTATTLTFQLTVIDNSGASATDTIDIVVQDVPVNQPPVANAGIDQSINENTSVTLSGTGTDSDGTISGYAWMQIAGPVVAMSGANTPTATFTSPDLTVNTVLIFRLTVTDNNGAVSTDSISVTVLDVITPTNQPPIANAGADNSVNDNITTNASLNGSGSDPDGSVSSYAWTQISGPAVQMHFVSSAQAQFTVSDVTGTTVLVFQLTVTDNEGATATDSVNVTVIDAAGLNVLLNKTGAAQAVNAAYKTDHNSSVILSNSVPTDNVLIIWPASAQQVKAATDRLWFSGSQTQYQWRELKSTGELTVIPATIIKINKQYLDTWQKVPGVINYQYQRVAHDSKSLQSGLGFNNVAHSYPILGATAIIDTQTYNYDTNGNILDTTTITNGANIYVYDALNRLVNETLNGHPQATLGYDLNGNRISFNQGTTIRQNTYLPNSNILDFAGSESIGTDAAGNRISDRSGARTFNYSEAGRLWQVYEGTTLVATYSYNGLGRRVKKVTQSGATYYHYDLNGKVIVETNASGVVQREYAYLNSAPLAQFEANGSVTYLHTDHLGTPRRGTNAAGALVWSWESDGFGADAPSGSVMVNLRFAGQYFDEETGLHYNYFRDYDPSTGRYVQSDPIGLDGGLNTYGYVGGNPLTRIDPTGELWFALPWLLGGGTTTTVATGGLTTGQVIVGGLLSGTMLSISGDSVKSDSQCKTKDDDYCSKNAERLNVERNFLIDAQGMILGGSNARDQETLTALNNDIVKFNREVSEHNKLCPNLRVLPLRTLGQQGVRY